MTHHHIITPASQHHNHLHRLPPIGPRLNRTKIRPPPPPTHTPPPHQSRESGGRGSSGAGPLPEGCGVRRRQSAWDAARGRARFAARFAARLAARVILGESLVTHELVVQAANQGTAPFVNDRPGPERHEGGLPYWSVQDVVREGDGTLGRAGTGGLFRGRSVAHPPRQQIGRLAVMN